MTNNEHENNAIEKQIDSTLSALEWVTYRSETMLRVVNLIREELEQFENSHATTVSAYCNRWDVETVPKSEYARIAENRVVVDTLKRAIRVIEGDVFYD